MSQIKGYFNAVLTLFKGSAAAHFITLISLPLLSRIYSQEQFGELAVVISSSAILAILLPLRLDLSIYNAKEIEGEAHAWLTAIFVSSFNLLVCYIVLIFTADNFANYFNLSIAIVFMVPLMAYLLALFNISTNLAISRESFVVVKKVKVIRSAVLNLSQFGFSFMPIGLVFGEAVGRASGIFKLFNSYRKYVFSHYNSLCIRTELMRHIGFVKYSVVGGLANSVSMQLPSLFFASQYSLKLAGTYLLTNRLAAIPIAFVGQSMQQVFSSKYKKLKITKEKLSLINKVILVSFLVSCSIFLIAWIIIPFLIPLILGEKWQKASDFFILLIPMLAAQLGVFPITNVLNIINKQRVLMFWDIGRLCCLILLIYFTMAQELAADVFLLSYSVLMSLFYLILFHLVKRLVACEK